MLTHSYERAEASRAYHAARHALVVLAAIVGITIAAMSSPANANEPPVPPGRGGIGKITVALLGPGIDYRLPELKGRLARDGEGDLISWDFTDNDNKPFAEGGIGDEIAREFVPFDRVRLVVAKEMPGDPKAFGHMMLFAAKTPARLVAWVSADPMRRDWSIFLNAAAHFKDHLFIIARTQSMQAPLLATLGKLSNVLVVDVSAGVKPATSSGALFGKIVGAVADAWAGDLGRRPEDLKAAFAAGRGAAEPSKP